MSTLAPRVCRCSELTAGYCDVCRPDLYGSPPLEVKIRVDDIDGLVPSLKSRLADLLREHADRESGRVRLKLREVADVFEGE